MNKKVQCPECSREFSEHLIKFPVFFNDKDETMVYYTCPLCSKEKLDKKNDTFTMIHSQRLYEEAVIENKKRRVQTDKKPMKKKDIKWTKLVRLTQEEREKVIKRHPLLLEGDYEN